MSGCSTHTWTRRTHTCGELRMDNCGESVVLNGWVHRRRDQGGLIFIDLRDRYGITQVVVSRDENAAAHEIATDTRAEYVLGVIGNVRQRPSSTVNDELRTGEIEIGGVASIEILASAKPLPFEITSVAEIDETVRLTSRYLDLLSLIHI